MKAKIMGILLILLTLLDWGVSIYIIGRFLVISYAIFSGSLNLGFFGALLYFILEIIATVLAFFAKNFILGVPCVALIKAIEGNE